MEQDLYLFENLTVSVPLSTCMYLVAVATILCKSYDV